MNKEPQILSPVYNNLDYVRLINNNFTSILSELVITDWDLKLSNTSDVLNTNLANQIDTSIIIKRFNLYNDNTVRYDNSDIIRNNFKRISFDDTFRSTVFNPYERTKMFFKIIDTENPQPTITPYKYVFNGVLDRNRFLNYDFNDFINKPLMDKNQMFYKDQKGQFEIFNGQYNDDTRNTWEYINFESDIDGEPGDSTGLINTTADSIVATTTTIEVVDGYLYNYRLGGSENFGINPIINNSQPNGTTGWRLPSREDWFSLRDTLDPSSPSGVSGNNNNNAAIKLKNVGWGNGTNESGFSATPAGFLFNPSGGAPSYFGYDTEVRYMTSTELDSDNIWFVIINSTDYLNVFGSNQGNKYDGYYIRLCRPAVIGEPDFNPVGYVGNNGIEYPTIKIGDLVWLCNNLREFQWDASLPAVNTENFIPTLAKWDDPLLTDYGYTLYGVDGTVNTCYAGIGYTYPCISVFPLFGNTTTATINLNITIPGDQVVKKIFRIQNTSYEKYENHPVGIYYPYITSSTSEIIRTSKRYTTNRIPNTWNKQVSLPCYPGSFKTLKGKILDDDLLKIEVYNLEPSDLIGVSSIFIKFIDLNTNTSIKLDLIGKSFSIIDIQDNILTLSGGFNNIGWNDDYECLILTNNSVPLLKPSRNVISCSIGTTVLGVDSEFKTLLTLTINNTDFNKLTTGAFLQLYTEDQGLLDVFGDEKIMMLSRNSSTSTTITLFTRKVVDDDLYNYIINNTITSLDFISYDDFIPDDFQYNNKYTMYSSEMLVAPYNDENLYQSVFHEPIVFNQSDCIKNHYTPIQIGYYNDLGGIEYLLFNKDVRSRNISRLDMRKPLEIGNRNTFDEELYNYNTTVEYTTNLTTDWLTEEFYKRYLELVESSNTFEVDYTNNTHIPIVITNTDVVERTYRNDKLFIFQIDYIRTYNKNIKE